MITRMLQTWSRAVPKVVTRAESAFLANLQKLRRGMKWLYSHYGIRWISVQLYMLGRGKLFLQREGCCDTVFPEELVQGCSFLPGSLGSYLLLHCSWWEHLSLRNWAVFEIKLTQDIKQLPKGVWQLLYLKFNQWPKGETHFYDVTLNLDDCSCLSVSTVMVSCFFVTLHKRRNNSSRN